VSRLSTFKRAFASTLGFNVIARGLSAITLVVLLRALPTEDFAFIVLMLNVGQFLGGAATGGLRLRYARLEAERVSRGEDEPSAFHSTLMTGSALVVGVAIVGFLIATILDIGQGSGERITFALLGTGFTLASASVEMAIYHYQAQLAFVRAGVIEVLRNGLILVVAVVAWAGVLDSGDGVGLGFDVTLGVLALATSLPVALATRGAVRGKDGRFGFGKETVALTFYSLASAGWAFLDIFLVAALLDATAVASYGAALRYMSLVTGPVPALIAILRVRTSQHDMVDSRYAQREMLNRWFRQTFWPAAVLIGSAAVASIWLIPVLDNGRYPESVPIFQIFLALAFVQYVVLPATGLLIAQKRYSTIGWVNVVAVVVNVAAAVIAAPTVGVIGVAICGSSIGIGQTLAVVYLAIRSNPGPERPPAEVEAIDQALVNAWSGEVDVPSPSPGDDD
jgi:O-antigen/teichoic acid export membrane protein